MLKLFYADEVWKPTDNNKDQYLQVDLGNLEPLFGTVVWGNPKENEYVTSYMVLYSDNGQRYTYVTDAGDSPAVSITFSLSVVLWKYITFIMIILSSSIPFIIIVTLTMFIDNISLSYSLKKEVNCLFKSKNLTAY